MRRLKQAAPEHTEKHYGPDFLPWHPLLFDNINANIIASSLAHHHKPQCAVNY